jgi:hypothetical protein
MRSALEDSRGCCWVLEAVWRCQFKAWAALGLRLAQRTWEECSTWNDVWLAESK